MPSIFRSNLFILCGIVSIINYISRQLDMEFTDDIMFYHDDEKDPGLYHTAFSISSVR